MPTQTIRERAVDTALRAIIGTAPARDAHITIMETCRVLKLTTEEAVELHARLRRASLAETDTASDRYEMLRLAKSVVNTYANDFRYR